MTRAVIDAIVALAALVSILDYFGLKPKQPLWGLAMPLSRNWKLGIMLGLVAASFGLSGYGFYRSLRPRIVERIVEKPVDRIVEKTVQTECPKQQVSTGSNPRAKRDSSTKANSSPPQVLPTTTINAPNGIAIGGGEVTNPTVNNFGVSKQWAHFSDQQKDQLVAFLSKVPSKAELFVTTSADSDTYAFANEFVDVLKRAHWDVSDVGIAMRSGPPVVGVLVVFHGEPATPGERFFPTPDTPHGALLIAMQSLGITVGVQREPHVHEGHVQITVGAPPK